MNRRHRPRPVADSRRPQAPDIPPPPNGRRSQAHPFRRRRAALAELARTHIEALRGQHDLDADDESASDETITAFAHAAKAQGPPN